jgi:hypothetical protein
MHSDERFGGRFVVRAEPDGWRLGRFAALETIEPVAHAVTTRDGLDVEIVRADRARACSILAGRLGLDGLAACRQVHGDAVRVVDAGRPAGEGDALVTTTPGVGVACLSADCPVVLLADRGGRVAGAAHASWRGTVRSIVARLIETCQDVADLDAGELVACLSPSAGPCCYEVGAEVLDEARARLGPRAERFFPRIEGRTVFDLWSANVDQLRRAGVPEQSIHVARVCTICHHANRFPSHRREGDAAGRFLAAVGLRRLASR